MSPETPRVQFIHGLESNPRGAKARFLAEHFEALTPGMNTYDFAGAVATQREALEAFRPDVLVGSSFGGAIAVELLGQSVWRGPTVLLAAAAAKLGVVNRLPAGVAVTIVHGLRDEIIPLDDSRALAQTGEAGLVELIEVDDDHRLQSLVDSGRLAELVRATLRRAGQRTLRGARGTIGYRDKERGARKTRESQPDDTRRDFGAAAGQASGQRMLAAVAAGEGEQKHEGEGKIEDRFHGVSGGVIRTDAPALPDRTEAARLSQAEAPGGHGSQARGRGVG